MPRACSKVWRLNPSTGRLAIEAYYKPVQTIGGELGLVVTTNGSQQDVLICDVTGHGISSALLANRIYSAGSLRDDTTLILVEVR